ncbi:MAG: hypothetical protein COW34_11545, partial [Armatimonadetes bacterium CG17_big_fil_post_rev_8_21_14_2_50_66_6]
QGTADSFPYTGPEQHMRCAPDYFAIEGFQPQIFPPTSWDCLVAWPDLTILDLMMLGLPCQ